MKFSLEWLASYLPGKAPDLRPLRDGLTTVGFVVETVEGEGPGAVLDIEVTANRPDGMNHRGLAREAAVALKRTFADPEASLVPKEGHTPVSRLARVVVEEPDLCPRYSSRVLEGIRVGPSPAGAADRLVVIGQSPISAPVDATNHVLWDIGQPLHAFDLDRLGKGPDGLPTIIVRRAKPGEKLVTLDGVERTLTPDVLVIADAEKAVALAGIMGGLETAISSRTTRVLLESAHFDPGVVRRGARLLGMHTDASHRFERGTDPATTIEGLDRAARLISASCGGSVARGVLDVYPGPRKPIELSLRMKRFEKFVGMEVGEERAREILRGLGFELLDGEPSGHIGPAQKAGGTGGRGSSKANAAKAGARSRASASHAATARRSPPSRKTPGSPVVPGIPGSPLTRESPVISVVVPSWRVDVSIEEDLIEEVIRCEGYDRLPETLPRAWVPPARPRLSAVEDRVRDVLSGAGLMECQTYSFVSAEENRPFEGIAPGAAVVLENPLGEPFTTMRATPVIGLLQSARHNVRRGQKDLAFFEVGHSYGRGSGAERIRERPRVAILLTGKRRRHWSEEAQPVDFFDGSGAVATLLRGLGLPPPSFEAVSLPVLAPGRSACVVTADGAKVGWVGILASSLSSTWDVEDPAVADLDLGLIAERIPPGTESVEAPPRLPGSEVDLTVMHPLTLTWAELASRVRNGAPAELLSVEAKVRYRGPGVPEGSVKTTMTLRFGSAERSLAREEINAWRDAAAERILAGGDTKVDGIPSPKEVRP